MIPQGHARFPRAVAEILLRVIAELLTNVRKHACANSVEVSSAVRADGAIVVSVKDDGIGLAAPEHIRPLADGAFGLWSINSDCRRSARSWSSQNDAGLCARVILPPGRAPGASEQAKPRLRHPRYRTWRVVRDCGGGVP